MFLVVWGDNRIRTYNTDLFSFAAIRYGICFSQFANITHIYKERVK
jgi:hypothetical protein